MLTVMTILIGGLFYEDNKEFFVKADEQLEAGYTWNAMKCRAPLEGTLHITAKNEATGEELVCFKLEK